MSSAGTNLFGIHEQALGLWEQRGEVITSNLANADTPGYQARDVDFKSALAHASGQGQNLALETTQSDQLGGASSSAALAYRVPTQPTMDGNTVDSQVEQSDFAANTVHYQASLSFITEQIHMLKTAITGGS